MGNGDRRRELASKRKEDQKNEVSRKQSGAEFATPSEIRARLLGDCIKKSIPENDLIAWINVISEEDQKLCCSAFVRNGFCDQNRCRFEHKFTLFHLKGVPQIDAESEGMEPVEPKQLRSINPGAKLVYDRNIRTKVRQKSSVRFIQMGDRLVFDKDYPSVFAAYCESEVIEKPDFDINQFESEAKM
jgi:hypothetical protein